MNVEKRANIIKDWIENYCKNESFQPKTLDMSGGISTLPIVPPILNPNVGRGGEGGGGQNTGPAPDTSGFDYETDAYGLDDMSAKDKGLTDDEQDALDGLNNPGLTKGMIGTTLGTMFGFVNPFTAIASLAYQSKKQKEAAEQAAREAATRARAAENKAAGTGGYQAGYGGDFMDGPSGAGYGMGAADKGGSDSMGSFAYGGRVPYMMGGLASLADIYD